ncbi:MAG TPA: CBS domain-containing protein [Candidatus Acidoferrum sp.]|nr:CBS domain-containing protein [Candidatus Acidoferrum sp.]
MKVKEVMTQSAVCCMPETNVGSAVELMWSRNVGMLPVVDDDGKLIGVVTDRDICIAMGTRNRLPGELTVGEIAIQKVFTCKPNDDIHEALYEMGNHQVRRLPVVNDQGVPQGLLSLDDLIAHSELGKLRGSCDLSSEEVAAAMKKIYALRQPLVRSALSKAAVN